MNRDNVAERYAELVGDWFCVEAYLYEGDLYYRYDAADPVTEPGQITFNRIADAGGDPVPVSVAEFHQAQKGDKLK